MTIVGELNTLVEAYAGMEVLRQRAIPPELTRSGDYLHLSVDDDFAVPARAILASDGKISEQYLRNDASTSWYSFEHSNA